MNENQLKRAFNDIHIKDDMQKRLIDNCTQSTQVRNIVYRRENYRTMKKRAVLIVASITILVVGFTGVVYGQDIYEKIRDIVMGGYAHYIDVDYKNIDNNSSTDTNDADRPSIDRPTFTDLAEAQSHLTYDLKLPAYLPEGYQFEKIKLYGDSGDYADVYFTKGKKYIYLQTRLMNEETAFTAELGKLVEIEINGYKGLKGKENLDVDIDGVMYMFSTTTADVGSDELVKMVETIN